MSPWRWALPVAFALLAGAAWAAGPSVLDQLDELEMKASEASNRLDNLQRREKELSRSLKEADASSADTRATLDAAKGRLAARLRAFYKLHQVGRLEYLIGARDFAELDKRRAYLERLAYLDGKLRAQVEGSLKEALASQAQALKEREELRTLIGQVQAEKAALDAQVAAKRRLVSDVRQDPRLGARAQREMASAREQLNERETGIGGRETDPQAGHRFASQKGRLLCPVRARVTSGYGEVVENGAKHFHGGLDFDVAYGTALRAPADGTVAFAGRLRGFGTLLILDHGGGYHTLYAHLSGIGVAPGAKVQAGDAVAQTGDSGSLQGPMLYFELRVSGKTQDPAAWFTCR